jgi:acetyltransferase-like isoleucine patch superfamily enzyme
VPLKPSTVPPARGAPPRPAYVPPVTPPAAPPPAGLLARLRARRAALRRGVSAGPGAALGRGVVLDVGPGGRIELSAGCAIGAGSRLHARAGAIVIGAGAVVGERCALAAHAGIELGEEALLGDEAVVIDFDHRYEDAERPVRVQGIVAEPVRIGPGARIGTRAAVQRGVTVGERADVAALAVVTSDVPPRARVGGVPAQPVNRSAGRGTRGGSPSPRAR